MGPLLVWSHCTCRYRISLGEVGSGFRMKLHRFKSSDTMAQKCLHVRKSGIHILCSWKFMAGILKNEFCVDFNYYISLVISAMKMFAITWIKEWNCCWWHLKPSLILSVLNISISAASIIWKNIFTDLIVPHSRYTEYLPSWSCHHSRLHV